MSAFSPLAWHDFFVGAAGASAALTGLLFVAISINLEQILKFPHLPGRAAGTLGILLSVLVVSCFGLAPGQSREALGVEIVAVGVALVVQALLVGTPQSEASREFTWSLEPILTLLLPAGALVAGGASLLAGGGGGLYWVLAATILAFVVAAVNAWVLLIEVLR